MEIILQVLLNANTKAKRLHWTTKSFAQHVALQELYEMLDEMTDKLAEEYMGKYGNDQTINTEADPFKDSIKDADAITFIQVLTSQLESLKSLLPDDAWLVNTYEELQSKVSQIKYKLENLK